jgi:thioredoxin 1
MKEINEIEFKENVLNSTGKVLVDFYADWCGPCKTLGPILEEAAKEANIKVFKVNVDDCHNLVHKMNIRGIPAVFLFENGINKKMFSGTKQKADIISWINS